MVPFLKVARLLRGTSNASQSSSMANASSSEFQQAQLRQELLMGHLVLMAASSQPPSATRALVNNLQVLPGALPAPRLCPCLLRIR